MWILYTDGACSGNPGPGGWGVVLKHNEEVTHLRGEEAETTNNRMELMAVIEGLMAVDSPEDEIHLHSDSQYVLKGMTTWMAAWKRKGWKTYNHQPVKNQDLWQQLDGLMAKCPNLHCHWVRGHNGDPDNEIADALARGIFPKSQSNGISERTGSVVECDC